MSIVEGYTLVPGAKIKPVDGLWPILRSSNAARCSVRIEKACLFGAVRYTLDHQINV